MIQKLNLLHYLTEDAYKKICVKLGLDESNAKENIINFNNEKISKINLFNIKYKQFGHIWFMDAEVDFPKFNCDYDTFEQNLYSHYHSIFGEDIMLDFPSYDQLCCSYVEYSSIIELSENSTEIIVRLKEKCVPEQMDKGLWDNYKKPHGTIEFCVQVNDKTIETLARCHGTALKKRIPDVTMHKTVGLIPSAAINKITEDSILNWLYKRYNITDI